MRRLCCTAQFVAALTLAGCGTAQIFADYDIEEDPAVESTPWPRLVDMPAAPEPGEYSSTAPDPARGRAVNDKLRTEAAVATVRAEIVSAPIMTAAERRALIRRARRAQERRKQVRATGG